MTLINRFAELLKYRELIRNLVIRDLKLRYRSSIMGFLWCLVNPLLMMLVFTVVFTVLLRNNTTENYPVFILIGILAWNLHSTAVTGGITSVVNNAGLVQKVYFPREVLPISVVLSNTVNFVLALIVLFVLIFISRIPLSLSLVYLPLLLLLQVIFTIGLALGLSAINVFFRDTAIIMDTLMLAWFFLTPIFYSVQDLFPDYARMMYWLNPVASFISSYRIILYNGGAPGMDFLLRTVLTSVIVFVIGYVIFARVSKNFGEVL